MGEAERGSWDLEEISVRCDKIKIDNRGDRPLCELERFRDFLDVV